MNNRILYTPKEKRFVKKRKNYRWYMLIGFLLVASLCVGLFFIARMSSLSISQISINGLATIHEEDTRNTISSVLSGSFASGLIPYRFILFAPTQAIAARLQEKFPLIAKADIQTKFPDTLIVNITEHQLFGALCNDALNSGALDQDKRDISCAYLDTEGIAYQKAPETQGFLIIKISINTPQIAIGQETIDRTMLQRIKELDKALPRIIGSPIASYRIERPASHELVIITKQGFSLLVKDDGDIDSMLYTLKTVLEKEIGARSRNLDYIDLRFGNKVFYKFK